MDFILHYHYNHINNNNKIIHTQVVTFQNAADDTKNCLYRKKIDMQASIASSSSSSVSSSVSSLSVGGCATLMITGTLMKVTSDTERHQLMTHNEELLQFEQYIYDYKSINHQDHNDDNHIQFYKLQISAMKLIRYLEGQSSAVPVDIEMYHAITYSELELMDYDDFEDY